MRCFGKGDPDAPKHTLKEWTVGDYDWKYLCTPQWPWCTGGKKRDAPKFFAKDAWCARSQVPARPPSCTMPRGCASLPPRPRTSCI